MRKLSAMMFTALLSLSAAVQAEVDEQALPEGTDNIATEVNQQTEVSRERIVHEATEALSATYEALASLDGDEPDKALDELATAMGKLELVVARYPELALAPVAVHVTTHDVQGSTGAVMEAISNARRLLGKGELQAARHLLKDIGSEVVISTTNLPLATYPQAIKQISPLIDEGRIDEARLYLQAALNTLVVTEEVLPLPVLRSQAMLNIAAAFADQPEKTEEQHDVIEKSLAAVQEQLELAELLGYGSKKDFKAVYKQLDDLRDKFADNEASQKYVESTRNSIAQLWQG